MFDEQRLRYVPVTFLLAQVGGFAAREFAKALAPLKLSPPDAGILRILARSPGINQQELAKRLDMHASRLVAVIDALEERGLVAREPNPADRRVYSLRLTQAGSEGLAAIGQVARAHNETICTGLDDNERMQLGVLLEKIAAQQGLTPGVHPGYKEIGTGKDTASCGKSQPPE